MEAATKAPDVRQADKVLQALVTLAALIDSTIREVKSLDADFQTRLLQAVHDTETSLQAQTAEHIERARQEVQDQLNSKYHQDLQVALDGLKSEFEVERERFNKELMYAVDAASKLEAERSGLIAEVQQVKADSAAEVEKAREEAKAAAAKLASPGVPSPQPASLQQEVARAEAKLEEILKLIDNPQTELSTVIRKNVEKSELEAYLRGIRLVLDSGN